MDLLMIAMDPSGGPEGEAASRHLLQACQSDPFLKELESNLLAEADGVQTFGKIKHIRDTVLDIQPSGQRVVEMMDFQRNAMALLQRVVACVEKEAESWKTGVQALQKAYVEEEKAKKKAEEKIKKDEDRKAAKAAKAAAKKEKQLKDKEEKAAAAAAAAAEQHHSGSDDDDEGKRQRRRRTGAAATELSPEDPAVLRTLRVSPEVTATQLSNDVKEFLTHICTHPELPAVCRLKKGMTKKVLAVSRQ
jgi:flagellar biosynthesis GTPase FlhF